MDPGPRIGAGACCSSSWSGSSPSSGRCSRRLIIIGAATGTGEATIDGEVVRRRVPGRAGRRGRAARGRPRRPVPRLRRPAALRLQAVDARSGPSSTRPRPAATSTGPGTSPPGWGRRCCLTAALAAALALVAGDDLLASVATWAFVLNVAGSAGDMLMMRKVASYPGTTRFEDTGEGFVAFGPPETATAQS